MQKALLEGSIIKGHYRVERLLGKGGCGAVYLVHDLELPQNTYALKEIIDVTPRKRRHFATEAEILKRLEHPSLPHLYRVFEEPARWRTYILMDYIEGQNLEALRRQSPDRCLPLEEVSAILAPIFGAITYLHSQQPPIIHSDIKPANIIVPPGGKAVLVDLGIAREFDQDGTTSLIRHASPGYGAPEQYVMGTETRTDIYGLGATLYTLLSGVVPIDAFFRLTSLASHGKDPLVPLDELVPELPDEVVRAITQAMELEKEKRFDSIEAFQQALQLESFIVPVLTSEPLDAPTLLYRPRTMPAIRPIQIFTLLRRRALVALLLFFMFCFTFIFTWMLSSQPRPQTLTQAMSGASALSPASSPEPSASPRPTTANRRSSSQAQPATEQSVSISEPQSPPQAGPSPRPPRPPHGGPGGPPHHKGRKKGPPMPPGGGPPKGPGGPGKGP